MPLTRNHCQWGKVKSVLEDISEHCIPSNRERRKATYEDGFPARDRSKEIGNPQRDLPKILRQSQQKCDPVDPHQNRDWHSNLGHGQILIR